jgi:alpha-ketoglutarate-dependent taurine dioxygenase
MSVPDVEVGVLEPKRALPLVVRPIATRFDGIEWLGQNLAWVTHQLATAGALLFRGWPIATVDAFHRFVVAAAGAPLPYTERTSPRTRIRDRIYTSTDYPASEHIFPHNEHSYSLTFPGTLAFWAHIPALSGGETPVADTRRVYARIDPAVREKFERLGWMYVRNFDDRVGLRWQEVFQTDKASDVDEYCVQARIEREWKSTGRLRTWQVRPATIRHPATGEHSWFNHVAFFHVTTLTPGAGGALLQEYGEDELPNNTYYGDGSPIEPEVVEHLRLAYGEELVPVRWQKGDVLLVDNIITAHARNPFSGPRRILTAFANAITRDMSVLDAGRNSGITANASRSRWRPAVVRAIAGAGPSRLAETQILDTHCLCQLGLDSFAVVSLLLRLEHELGIDFGSVAEARAPVTVADVVRIVESAVTR